MPPLVATTAGMNRRRPTGTCAVHEFFHGLVAAQKLADNPLLGILPQLGQQKPPGRFMLQPGHIGHAVKTLYRAAVNGHNAVQTGHKAASLVTIRYRRWQVRMS